MENNNIEIIYEDEHLVAVNKPSGLIVHSDGRTKEPTLADWVVSNYPEAENVGEPIKLSNGEEIQKHGIVHRLDRDTSGVIVIAKNQETFLHLKEQFQDRTIEKTYRAIVHGKVKEQEGVIDIPIGKSKRDFRQWLASLKARGKLREAKTEYKVLAQNPEYSYVEVYPKTGRTHQIRVHFKAIGHPLVCDKLYAPKRECMPELGRLGLHAWRLTLRGQGGEILTLEAPLPEDMEKALATQALV